MDLFARVPNSELVVQFGRAVSEYMNGQEASAHLELEQAAILDRVQFTQRPTSCGSG